MSETQPAPGRPSSWCARNSRSISGRRPAPWPISACRIFASSRRGRLASARRLSRETPIAAASGAAGLLERAKIFDTCPGGGRRSARRSTPQRRASAGQGKPVLVPNEAMPAGRRAFCSRRAARASCSARSGPGSTTTRSCSPTPSSRSRSTPDYGSLNLAQAVLLVGYEWFRAAQADHGVPPAPAERSPPARKARPSVLLRLPRRRS